VPRQEGAAGPVELDEEEVKEAVARIENVRKGIWR
jgi:hypothetical protein